MFEADSFSVLCLRSPQRCGESNDLHPWTDCVFSLSGLLFRGSQRMALMAQRYRRHSSLAMTVVAKRAVCIVILVVRPKGCNGSNGKRGRADWESHQTKGGLHDARVHQSRSRVILVSPAPRVSLGATFPTPLPQPATESHRAVRSSF
ncbi:hypothetical protein L1887_47076 [Cichorium endivia]|nr:hypothetical protein L1887_47076 [Cichorium endivia]